MIFKQCRPNSNETRCLRVWQKHNNGGRGRFYRIDHLTDPGTVLQRVQNAAARLICALAVRAITWLSRCASYTGCSWNIASFLNSVLWCSLYIKDVVPHILMWSSHVDKSYPTLHPVLDSVLLQVVNVTSCQPRFGSAIPKVRYSEKQLMDGVDKRGDWWLTLTLPCPKP